NALHRSRCVSMGPIESIRLETARDHRANGAWLAANDIFIDPGLVPYETATRQVAAARTAD
ncbi:MAG TPA: hypothetical protein VET25_08000, partial [Aestuariivirgaceae bacterium]|nr:hypothetical protein [Aestuariivirgaceae bacterium]